ncbi:MAG: aldo/keto reductase [Chthoniobacterales bacterium]
METRRLGNSDLEITRIGFGAWAIGGGGWQFAWGVQDDRESIEAIHRALECGMNWIDTAPAYGTGHSEEIVAQALKDWKGSRPYVFTKCGLTWDEKRNIVPNITPASIRKECEDSLNRLQVDCIDLYQIHWPKDELKEAEDAWSTVVKLKEEGKIRWGGVSNFSAEEMECCQKIAPVTSLQPPYSLVKPDVEKSELPFCLKNGIGVIVYAPMASGLLTGAMTKERATQLPEGDWRSRNPEFQEPKLTKNLAIVERLRKVAARHNCSPGEVAIAWTLLNPAVTAAIVGARSAQQVDGICKGANIKLSAGDIAEITSV